MIDIIRMVRTLFPRYFQIRPLTRSLHLKWVLTIDFRTETRPFQYGFGKKKNIYFITKCCQS